VSNVPIRNVQKAAAVHPNLDLPEPSDWKKVFQRDNTGGRGRVCVRNSTTAQAIAEAFVPEGSKDLVIIEAFPGLLQSLDIHHKPLDTESLGPGALTRALMQLPKGRIRKLIVLEDMPLFLDYLRVRIFAIIKQRLKIHVLPASCRS
jgi:mitochondrial transcription factor 1